MSSINTNRTALQALQAANAANREIGAIQKRLSTGLKVGSTTDDSAAFIVAQSLRSDSLAWHATAKGLSRVRSTLDVAIAGAEQISDLIITLRQKGTELVDAAPSDQLAIRRDIGALIDQIDRSATSAEFRDVNLLIGGPLIETVSSHSYGAGWTPLSQSGFQGSISALPPETIVQHMVQTRHVLPSSVRTPASYEAVQRTMNGSTARTVPLDGGAIAGRFNLLLEQTKGADRVEIWQKGVRVAATGRPYTADGAAVGAASPVDGPKVISFDYDPAKGQDIEIRVTPGGSSATEGFWQVSDLSLQDPSEPVPEPIQLTASSSRITTTAALDSPFRVANPEQAAAAVNDPPETNTMPQGNVRTVQVPGGSQAGRVDVSFDAFDAPDTLEIWQEDTRVAATGRGYAAGGAPVEAGRAVSGMNLVSFDYDPDKGPLTFRFNENGAPESAWHVGTMTLYPASGVPQAVSSGASFATQDAYGPQQYDFNVTPGLAKQRVRSRDMTSAGLGLDGLENADPTYLLSRIQDAEARVNKAVSYFGNKARLFDLAEQHARGMVDIRDAAVGALVDADMGKEAAALQAAQVRQQLASQALGIANQSPRFILDLFD